MREVSLGMKITGVHQSKVKKKKKATSLKIINKNVAMTTVIKYGIIYLTTLYTLSSNPFPWPWPIRSENIFATKSCCYETHDSCDYCVVGMKCEMDHNNYILCEMWSADHITHFFFKLLDAVDLMYDDDPPAVPCPAVKFVKDPPSPGMLRRFAEFIPFLEPFLFLSHMSLSGCTNTPCLARQWK